MLRYRLWSFCWLVPRKGDPRLLREYNMIRVASSFGLVVSLALSGIIMLIGFPISHWLGVPSFAVVPLGWSLVSLILYPAAQAWYAKLGKKLTVRTWAIHVT